MMYLTNRDDIFPTSCTEDYMELPRVVLLCNDKNSVYLQVICDKMDEYFEYYGKETNRSKRGNRKYDYAIIYEHEESVTLEDDFYSVIDMLEEINGDVLTHSNPHTWSFGDVEIKCENF